MVDGDLVLTTGALLHADGGYGVVFGGTSDRPEVTKFDGTETQFASGGELLSTSGSNGILAGTGGADFILDFSTSTNNTLIGAGGSDILRVSSALFAAVDGGIGLATLLLMEDGAGGFDLDLTLMVEAGSALSGVERIDMTNGESNGLTLGLEDVLQEADDDDNEVAELTILGDSDDTLNIGSEWFITENTVTTSEGTFIEYASSFSEVGTLLIDTDITVVPPPIIA